MQAILGSSLGNMAAWHLEDTVQQDSGIPCQSSVNNIMDSLDAYKHFIYT